jgi:acetyl esterase/lipase
MSVTVRRLAGLAGALLLGTAGPHTALGAETPEAVAPGAVVVDSDGAVHLPALTVPVSDLLAPETRAAFAAMLTRPQPMPGRGGIAQWRRELDAMVAPVIDQARQLYPVTIEPVTMAGIYTEVITPAGGVPARNQERVLMQLHGGGFMTSARTGGQTESIPVAALGGFRVVAVDYRQYPEARYPAATEDAVAVYRALLQRYKPENIGIFGCSAGGMLTAEVVAWAAAHGLPRPGAAGIFCSGASLGPAGDSGVLGVPLTGITPRPGVSAAALRASYFEAVDRTDPLASPGDHDTVLAGFPPTLVLTATRDFALSGAVRTHARMVAAGAPAELYVIEGLGHGGHTLLPASPEARAANAAIAAFFDRHLGR